MKTAAITGGTGFIGGALARELLSRGGYRVRILTRSLPASRLEGAEYAVISFSDPGSLSRALEGADFVVHLAARLFSRNRAGFERANAKGTADLVRAAASLPKRPEKFVYLSSLAAGGPSPSPAAPREESMREAPVSFYGSTKLGGEAALRDLASGMRFTILRPPIVYGKNESGVSKIAHWVRKGFMVNAGASDGAFSFIYVE
ncbi:MAG TPA: NAD-dependent epimerase/dehydratase family protein, partial [Elusimicrobiales bacterium]|nr:NAD-dependent epimerase/dehydratase family protein [Elusimicrobiales bacterium]